MALQAGAKTVRLKALGAIGRGVALATAASLSLAACAHASDQDPADKAAAKAEKEAEKKQRRTPNPKPPAFCATMDRVGLIAATAPGRVTITGETQSITLLPACSPPFIAQRVTASTAKRFILLFDDLRAQKPSGTVFRLNFVEGGGAELTNDASTIGALNFFAAPQPNAKGEPRRLSFDVTKTIRAMSDANHFEHMVITLKPTTPPPPGAELSVGKIQIVEQ